MLTLSGSTNAIARLNTVAKRLGIQVSLERKNELSDTTPVPVNLKPVGSHYTEDFFFAVGKGAVLRELRPLLHLDTISVTGETLGDRRGTTAMSIGGSSPGPPSRWIPGAGSLRFSAITPLAVRS